MTADGIGTQDRRRDGGGRTTYGVLVAAVLAAVVLGLVGLAGTAQARVVWLCHPGLADDPCEIPLATTVVGPGGGSSVRTPSRPPESERAVDCFYVYPTVVSDQATVNADQSRDPAIVSVAKYQAAAFSAGCRMFAPVYRQVTVAGVPAALLGLGSSAQTAYADVLEAWQEYMARENHGRGVILIGHSQGSILLRRLITQEIDPRPAGRRALVGAVLMGGQVTVRGGRTTGGDFQNVPLCTQRGQHGCVVAYSTYGADPSVAFFGDSSTDLVSGIAGGPHGAGYQVACTDPGALSGLAGPVGVTIPTEPFAPGFISAGIAVTENGPVPVAPTPWIEPPYRYSGACQTIRGAHIYRYHPVGSPERQLNEFPPTWGTHLIDMNLGLERLTTIAQLQTRGWLEDGFAVGAARVDRRDGTATVDVAAPGAGILTLSARTGARRVRHATTAPGRVSLRIVPSRATIQRLERRHRAALTIAITYRPYGGRAITRLKRLHLLLAR
jgi:hypothetical protein